MIIYRDRGETPATPRWPTHLLGARNLCRREAVNGALIAIADPIYLGPPDPETRWTGIHDEWEYCQVGALDPEQLARTDPGCSILIVRDGLGHPWRIPAVLDPEGNPALPMKLAVTGHDKIDGQQMPRWEHRPTEEQAALIAAARGALREITAGTIADLSLSIACGWVSLALAKTYHLTAFMIGQLAILDSRLTGRALMAMAGRPVPEGD